MAGAGALPLLPVSLLRVTVLVTGFSLVLLPLPMMFVFWREGLSVLAASVFVRGVTFTLSVRCGITG